MKILKKINESLKTFQIIAIWNVFYNTTSMAKVIHVHLLHNIDETRRKDWYFSSISAIYTVLTAEQVGATKNYLLHAGLSGNGTVCTKKQLSSNLRSFRVADDPTVRINRENPSESLKIPFSAGLLPSASPLLLFSESTDTKKSRQSLTRLRFLRSFKAP